MSCMDPYLEAIQAIPGDTPNEKFRWIGKVIKDHGQEGGVLQGAENWEEIPQPLASLVNIEAAKMFKIYSGVTVALKSNDSFIVAKALKANWYFDGSNKDITNVKYFFENLFPYVSLKTRLRIINQLSRNLIKDPKLADEFFLAISTTYGVDQIVTRLLEACSESFAYDAIVQHRIELDVSLLKTMYIHKPNLVIRYLKLKCKPGSERYYEYMRSLHILIKKNVDAFIEIYTQQPYPMLLTKRKTKIFLKKAREEFKRNPKPFIKILRLKLIDINLLENIFPKLFPEDIKKFETNTMLEYLNYYPEDKKLSFLFNSYKEVYGKNLLDDINNVTVTLLKMLPDEQRIQQARILLANQKNDNKNKDYSTVWRCYLPVEEVIDPIKKDISTATDENERVFLVKQLFYTCKINHDNDALLGVLTYCNNRHKNETAVFWSEVSWGLAKIYDKENFNEEHWKILNEIIVRNYVKKYLGKHYQPHYRSLIEKALLYRLQNNLPLGQMIEIFTELECKTYRKKWSILQDYPEYELKCLEAAIDIIRTKFESKDYSWFISDMSILNDLLDSIYHYNKRHVKLNSGRDKLSLRNYPWLMERVQSLIVNNTGHNYYWHIRNHLKTNEKDLFDSWITEDKEVENFGFERAVSRLKKDPKSILDNYMVYVEKYANTYNHKIPKCFLLECRWYKDIPIKFANEALKLLQTKKKTSYLCFLGTLFHGDTYLKLVETYMPKEKSIDVTDTEAAKNYDGLYDSLTSMLFSNPPVPVELIAQLCDTDYLSLALQVIRNVCDRTPMQHIKDFANTLSQKRVSVRKHGIRLMCAVQPLKETLDFLLSHWKVEKHHSIREVIYKHICKLFCKEPGSLTWSALEECLSTLTLKDWPLVTKTTVRFWWIPVEYSCKFIICMLQIVDNFIKEGLKIEETMNYLNSIFNKIDENLADALPEDFCELMLTKYLFNPIYVANNFAKEFLINNYLFLKKDKMESRMAVLSKLMKTAIEDGWDLTHPEKKQFCPVNYTVYTIMNKIASTFGSRKDPDTTILNCALKFYDDFLSHEMDIINYFLLTFMKDYAESSTIGEFSDKVCQKVVGLMEKHTPYYSNSIIFSLQSFFRMIQTDHSEEIELTIRESLLESPSHYAHLVASSYLQTSRSPTNTLRYIALISKLKSHNNPEVRCLIYAKLNCIDLNNS